MEQIKQYPDLRNLQGKTHTIKYGEVNHVKYRFQAISFSTDVLDTLVWNSPPIRRKKNNEEREKTSSTENVTQLPTISKCFFRRSMSLDCVKRFEDELSDCTSDYQSDDDASDNGGKKETTGSSVISKENVGMYSPTDLENKSKEELISIISNLQTHSSETRLTSSHKNIRKYGHPKIKNLIKKFER